MRTPTGSRNLTQTIVQDLGVAIVTGRYNGVAFPKEIELSRKYTAARTVTREAVKMLTSKGLLSARPRQGTRVELEENWNLLDPDVMRWLLERNFSLDLLIEFTEIRLSVEPSAAALAAQMATVEDCVKIRQAIDRMFAAEKGDDDPLESDIAFHVSVLHASGNRFLRQLREMIETALRFSIRKTNALKGVSLASVEDHKQVCDAILRGDHLNAQTKMYELIKTALDLMVATRNTHQTQSIDAAGKTAYDPI